MACGSCSKKRRATTPITKDSDLMAGYKYLTDRQINARLEVYKKRFCSTCGNRYKCDYKSYLTCTKRLK